MLPASASKDIVPLTKARARLTELCEAVRRAQREVIITKNGESCAALIDPGLLDHYHELEREQIHITLIEEAIAGVRDLKAGRTLTTAQLKKRYAR